MRCQEVHRIITQEGSERAGPLAGELKEHLESCSECALLQDQLERTWDALGSLPALEPSGDFLSKLKDRLRTEQTKAQAGWNWRRSPGWGWLAIAACAVVFAIVLVRNVPQQQTPPANSATKVTVESDRWDEQFLRDLEQTLQTSAADSLFAYDSWPGAMENPGSEAPAKQEPRKKMKEPL